VAPGLSDWLSYYVLNDIDEWMIPFFGASVYDNPRSTPKAIPCTSSKARENPTLIWSATAMAKVPWSNR